MKQVSGNRLMKWLRVSVAVLLAALLLFGGFDALATAGCTRGNDPGKGSQKAQGDPHDENTEARAVDAPQLSQIG